jgi:hypothetical protein
VKGGADCTNEWASTAAWLSDVKIDARGFGAIVDLSVAMSNKNGPKYRLQNIYGWQPQKCDAATLVTVATVI